MKKTVLVLVLVAGAVAGVARWRSDDAPAVAKDHFATNRLWIDHMPRSDREMVQLFVMLTWTGEPVGIFDVRSRWAGSFEAFRYELNGDEMRVVYPQKGDHETIKVKATACHEGGMDYCLELEGASRGVKRYYSRKGWEIRPNSNLDDVRKLAGSTLESLR
jgi:hypothetical protein